MRYATIAIIAILLVTALHEPAAAGITKAAIVGAPLTYTGTCPVTLRFTGTVTGSAGTSFTWSFNRSINGVTNQNTIGSFTLTKSNSLAEKDSILISSSTKGYSFDQLWIHGISGQSDVYSNKATFTVTCATPEKPVAAPTHFKATTDPAQCGNHVAPLFGAPICGAALQAGDLVFIWDYKNPNAVDGFRIYEITGGKHKKVATQSGMTAKALNIKAADAKNRCFAVAAYKGDDESLDSNHYCTGKSGVADLGHADLPITDIRTTWQESNITPGAFYCLDTIGQISNYAPPGQQMTVGFQYIYMPGSGPFPCTQKADVALRGAIQWDLSKIAGKTLISATLSFTNDSSFGNGPTPITCASQILYGVGNWSN